MREARKVTIHTSYDPKPIPTQSCDWSAITDDYDGPGSPIGYGRTESEAVAELFIQLADNDEANETLEYLARHQRTGELS